MYVILTSRPGRFRTEAVDGLRPVEAWDYLFGGRCKAHFVIAALERETKLRIVDETPPPVTNLVPTKFLERFPSVEAARGELQGLTRFGSVRAELAPVPLEPPA
jgi:hypothetical protein